MNYRMRLLHHLATYKSATLNVHKDGIWRKNGKPYAHILPEDLYDLNILKGIRRAFWSDPKIDAKSKLHRDFHHLNSSQAMCFNFFYPFLGGVGGNSPALLLNLLGYPGESIKRWEFEYIPNTKERTNFDFYLGTGRGVDILFEVKLSENGFGTAKRNERREAKLESIYSPALRGKVKLKYLDPSKFFDHYQLFRNISYVKLDGSAVLFLVSPRANSSTAKEVALLDEFLEPEIRANVQHLWLEDAVSYICAESSDIGLVEHFDAFAAKYMMNKAW